MADKPEKMVVTKDGKTVGTLKMDAATAKALRADAAARQAAKGK
jgi:hypothetical protein